MSWQFLFGISFALFLIGASIGSFLNVVIYRLPAGMSLLYPASRCPHCGHPIRFYDNLPIFGWLLLRGRCRDCQATISPRYPVIELCTACLFVMAGLVALRLVPGAPIDSAWIAATIYHAWPICTLLAAACIRIDGNRPPATLFLPAFAVGVFLPLVYQDIPSDLFPVLAANPASADPAATRVLTLLDQVIGLGAGALFGIAIPRSAKSGHKSTPALDSVRLALAMFGLFWGATSVALLSLVAMTAKLAARFWPRTAGLPLEAFLTPAAVIYLPSAAATDAGVCHRLGQQTIPLFIAVGFGIVWLLARFVSRELHVNDKKPSDR